MDNFILTKHILHLSKQKSQKAFTILLAQGILAGIYIALGAIGYLKVVANTGDAGLGSFIGALVFPLGIVAIIVMKAELFTSDSMVMAAVYAGKTKITKIFRVLLIILIANLIGAIFIALMTNWAGIFGDNIMVLLAHKAVTKVNMPIVKLFFSSILCNIIVSTGVCLSYRCREEITQIVVVWFAITVFVLSGTEHIVANMYYLFTAYFLGADISILGILYNLSIVAIGNFIGGGVIVSGFNYLIDYKYIK
ncbi:formate/nitrite transporter family protein [Vallitalea sp.]|jgi:formate/nitrite transporter|uniref:formate/nitrite transporter family protein n=1 Tax=Vallitalea sp. TaxID=1882829 RepID=UPI0025EC94B8|nr:formate/nitrite transporter family protein [Vallitalea sp.]MCT4688970.1 formate/nitrite transporter family protein [Vallitalea sp.]